MKVNEDKELTSVTDESPRPAQEVALLGKILRGMESEVSWFKRSAERRALVASQTAVGTTRIAQMVEVESHLAVHDKLKEWTERIRRALNAH